MASKKLQSIAFTLIQLHSQPTPRHHLLISHLSQQLCPKIDHGEFPAHYYSASFLTVGIEPYSIMPHPGPLLNLRSASVPLSQCDQRCHLVIFVNNVTIGLISYSHFQSTKFCKNSRLTQQVNLYNVGTTLFTFTQNRSTELVLWCRPKTSTGFSIRWLYTRLGLTLYVPFTSVKGRYNVTLSNLDWSQVLIQCHPEQCWPPLSY